MVEESLRYPLNDPDGTIAEGFIVYDDDWLSAPGVLVVHQWLGLGDTEKQHARDLAARGYVGFAADMYGVGCRGQPCGPEKSGALRGNPTELRRRAERGLTTLSGRPFVDSGTLGATGYCFGGTVVLEMARAGLPVLGVVSFHGGLVPLTGDTRIPPDVGVQIHTGDLDPITENDLSAMNQEMRDARLSYWGSFIYGNCAHGWTDPNSQRYRRREADEAHETMFNFFPSVFAGPNAEMSVGDGTRAAGLEVGELHAMALGVQNRTGSASASPLEAAKSSLATANRRLVEAKAEIARLQSTLHQAVQTEAELVQRDGEGREGGGTEQDEEHPPAPAPPPGRHLPSLEVFGHHAETWAPPLQTGAEAQQEVAPHAAHREKKERHLPDQSVFGHGSDTWSGR